MRTLAARLMILAICVMTAAITMRAQGQPRVDVPRPIDARVSLWAEELTSMEIRDLVKAGTTMIPARPNPASRLLVNSVLPTPGEARHVHRDTGL
jgi:hypothetical protein